MGRPGPPKSVETMATTATVFSPVGNNDPPNTPPARSSQPNVHDYVFTANYIDEPSSWEGGNGGLRYYIATKQYRGQSHCNGGGTIAERYAYSAYGTPTITDAAGTARNESAGITGNVHRT